jgi:hypothetical protein
MLDKRAANLWLQPFVGSWYQPASTVRRRRRIGRSSMCREPPKERDERTHCCSSRAATPVSGTLRSERRQPAFPLGAECDKTLDHTAAVASLPATGIPSMSRMPRQFTTLQERIATRG